ncbi:Uncharacterised protein [Mycobacteroides abscessus subsp. abscessus]|nr:Uncharacterised protein [Mycobacteroides abscessus subsp. abscessus]
MQRNNLGEWVNQMRGGTGHQNVSLQRALPRDTHLPRRQVAQSAVYQLRAESACPIGQVVLFDQRDAQTATRRVKCHPDPGDAAADD